MIDWTTILIQLFITIPATLVAIATLITAIKTKNKTDELATNVNGHMTNLLEKTKIVAEAVGKREGMATNLHKRINDK